MGTHRVTVTSRRQPRQRTTTTTPSAIMMKTCLIVLLAATVANAFLLDTVQQILPTACATDADCEAGSCCQKANLGRRSLLDNGVCTAVSVFGEKCNIHGSCGCASGLSCIQDDLALDLLHINPVGTCGIPDSA